MVEAAGSIPARSIRIKLDAFFIPNDETYQSVGIVEWLVPQDRIFFDLFEDLGTACTQAAELLVTITDDYTDIKNRATRWRSSSTGGTRSPTGSTSRLNRTFITPLEPEEMNRLTMALDDILDYIEGTTLMMMNYGITDADASMKEARPARLPLGERDRPRGEGHPQDQGCLLYRGEVHRGEPPREPGRRRHRPCHHRVSSRGRMR